MAWTTTIADASRIVELGFVLNDSMPRVSGVPPLVVATGVAHDDYALADGSSGTNETLLLGTHMGSHLDGLAHVSVAGRIRGGLATRDVQTRTGVRELDTTTVAPFVGPGYLLDLAETLGMVVVERDIELGVEDFAALSGEDLTGSVILIRTGWGSLWRDDPDRYASLEERRPGLGREAAAWLAGRGVRAVGTDTFSIETCRPRATEPVLMPAHVELLVERGVYIFEALDLEELASLAQARFTFVALPLRIAGATGSPVRPIAIL